MSPDCDANLCNLQEKLGYTFHQPDFLRTALCHSSYINECPEDIKCNERLEFLGDAVVNLAIAHILMQLDPDLREGKLSAIRAVLVSEKGLAEVAAKLDLPKLLILGRGEELDGGREKKSLISDAMEAVFAAVYLDSDFETTLKVVQRVFDSRPEEAMTKKNPLDYKTMLQEYLQNKKIPLPKYELINTSGPDHKRQFTIRITIDGREFTGMGSNKKKAQQNAAQNAMLYFTGISGIYP